MAKRNGKARVYWRERGGRARAYGDFRDFGDASGRREPLIPPGERVATTDGDVAQVLIAARLKELEAIRRERQLLGVRKRATLFDYARLHLIAKASAGTVTDRWLHAAELYLARAVDHFGANRNLAAITVEDVRKWTEHLRSLPSRRGGLTTGGTARHHLNALSNLYRRAQGEGYVLPGYNPVAALMDKPTADRGEACWLEVRHAALLLEAARTLSLRRADLAIPFLYPLVATFLLTGGRRAEVLGLEVSDVSFDRKTITFRPNVHRRLKTGTSARVVPLWPQLEEILRPYVFGQDRPPTRLLFPARSARGECMVTNFDGSLDQLAARAGWQAGEIRTKIFRHTYCAARLQTLDHGAPVSVYSVGRELGHGGEALVRRVYGHLGVVRHRSEVMEYRVEHFATELGDRLAALEPPAQPEGELYAG
jgi:integrase